MRAAPNLRSGRARPGSLSIQSRLLVMLISVSVLCIVTVGSIAVVNGRTSLQQAAVDKLTAARELRTGEIVALIGEVQREASLATDNSSAREASVALNAGWDALRDSGLTAAQDASLVTYFADSFTPELEDATGKSYSDSAFIAQSGPGRYLQYWYTRQGGGTDAALQLRDPGDGSAYSAAHATAQDYFAQLVATVEYEDVLVMNGDGDVVYSAYSGVDLGTNLVEGPYRDTVLAKAFDQAIASNSVDTVLTTDIERWIPSMDDPTMWVVSPIGDDAGITGVMALQIPLWFINDVMTGYQQWQTQGLGSTGEVYLVGADGLMRSSSRLLLQDPDAFASAVVAGGTTGEDAARTVAAGDSVLLQSVDGTAVQQALAGRTGTATGREYTGTEAITSYGPAQIDGLDWVVVAQMDSAEAFAPVTAFSRTLLLTALGLLLAVSVLSLVLSQAFTRPVRRLADAVRRVSDGDYDVRVPATGSDEIGDLSRAFNDMSTNLRANQDLIDHQRAENERLLRTLMPDSLAERYREGEETIAERHEDVAVVFAELIGFDDYAASLDSTQETLALNELMRGFDEAAQRSGVESVRTLRGGYLASCGLTVPRVDNARRAVEFALAMREVVRRYNDRTGAGLDLRAGVDCGAVTSGLVARASLTYDLWGDAVSVASRARRVVDVPGVYISDAVLDRMQGLRETTRVGSLDLPGGASAVWRVET